MDRANNALLESGRYRVGVDVGGTFTDIVIVDELTG